MSDKLYDWKTGKYVSVSDLTKDGTRFVKNNRTVVLNDKFIEQKPDNKDYYGTHFLRIEWFKCLTIDEIVLSLLREYGFSQEDIAVILKTYQKDISRRIEKLKRKYIKFIK